MFSVVVLSDRLISRNSYAYSTSNGQQDCCNMHLQGLARTAKLALSQEMQRTDFLSQTDYFRFVPSELMCCNWPLPLTVNFRPIDRSTIDPHASLWHTHVVTVVVDRRLLTNILLYRILSAHVDISEDIWHIDTLFSYGIK